MKMKSWIEKDFNQAEDWVLLTGASSGIGYEYLKLLCELGCNVITVSNEKDKLFQDKNQLQEKYGNKVRPLYYDLSDYQEIDALVAEISKYSISCLINNAGFGLKGRFEDHPPEKYRDIIMVNSMAPVIITRAILPKMQKANRGCVIHVSSINAYLPIPNNQVYTATKSFCMNYALAVARENRSSKIVFHLVLPGTTLTPFHQKQGAQPANMTMTPDIVAQRSFDNLHKQVFIPNRADRFLPWIVKQLPINWAMDFASYLLRKRLGTAKRRLSDQEI
ncbi:MAG: hypothetical protein CMP10_20780 [Zetaproteobacteria bacterium]|nr:hypothetical protein [Pseudobdellovibrionaceae bacterium]